jgi:AraC-like DNA-binding protein
MAMTRRARNMTLECSRRQGEVSGTSVSAGYAGAIIDFAVARGADRAALVAVAGIDPAQAGGPDARVPFAGAMALMRAAAAVTGDPAFAAHFGAESQFHEISIVGMISHSAATMAEAFEQMNRYARLVVEVEGHDAGNRFAIVRRDGETWMEDRTRNPGDCPELIESTFARFVWTTKRFLGDAPMAKAAWFTRPRPAHADEIARVLGVPVHFGTDRNALAIHESWLSLPLPHSNHYVFDVFIDRAEALLAELAQNTSVRGRVERALLAVLHKGPVAMAAIAASEGMGKSTLYRRLRDEGESFEAIVDALRHRMALHYLGSRKVSVNEAAYLLGFSDPASFSRAFRRWTGVAPGVHRRESLAARPS